MKTVAIVQSNYIPWKGYFDLINSVDEFVLYDDMQFTKRDWRNRNKIKTNQGAKWLTIPVQVKGEYYQKINETKVSNDKWMKIHWNSLCHAYSKAKFFNQYSEIFASLYLDEMQEINLLSEINFVFILKINEILGIKTKLINSNCFDLQGDKSEKLLGLCKDLNATHYLSGLSAKHYLDTELFESEGVVVNWMDYANYPEYQQCYSGFVHEVSILDLLFNEGRLSRNYMKTFK